MHSALNPKRGELYWLDWSPARGSEQAGRRPALIVSNDAGNRSSGTVIVAAVTSTFRRPYPFHVLVPETEQTGLRQESVVRCEQLVAVSKERLERRLGALPADLVGRVDDALRVALALA